MGNYLWQKPSPSPAPSPLIVFVNDAAVAANLSISFGRECKFVVVSDYEIKTLITRNGSHNREWNAWVICCYRCKTPHVDQILPSIRSAIITGYTVTDLCIEVARLVQHQLTIDMLSRT